MMETYEIEAPAWDGGDIFAFGGDGALAEPLVSVVIPCYNNGRFLGEAIGSAYPQGQRGDATLVIFREAGFASARTTAPPPVRVGVDPLLLPRLYVADADGEALARTLRRCFRG